MRDWLLVHVKLGSFLEMSVECLLSCSKDSCWILINVFNCTQLLRVVHTTWGQLVHRIVKLFGLKKCSYGEHNGKAFISNISAWRIKTRMGSTIHFFGQMTLYTLYHHMPDILSITYLGVLFYNTRSTSFAIYETIFNIVNIYIYCILQFKFGTVARYSHKHLCSSHMKSWFFSLFTHKH